MNERLDSFPIMRVWSERRASGLRDSIPWAMVAPHERQAEHNHDQTLKRLAERGGLSPCEAVAVLEDRPWHHMDRFEARARLEALCRAWCAP